MFTITELPDGLGILQQREELLTGTRCVISPGRLRRRIDTPELLIRGSDDCPFCPERIAQVTPTFGDGKRIYRGESITFPNLYPFSCHHTVTVITRAHRVDRFSKSQIVDALHAQAVLLARTGGYPSINWNYLASAGASIDHPHLQGLSDIRPSPLAERYIVACERYQQGHGSCYWDDWIAHEKVTERYLFGDEITWFAHAVPLGDREVRGILPINCVADLPSYIDTLAEGMLEVIDLYRSMGTHAFNASLFFDRAGSTRGFRAFCSMISRINPNRYSISDSAFMERIHFMPVILTMPEEFGRKYRELKN